MATDRNRPIHLQTEAALRGLVQAVSGPELTAELVEVVLTRYGDALRLGIEIPSEVRRWGRRVSLTAVKLAVVAVMEEAASWMLPEGDAELPEEAQLAALVRRRDEAESLIATIRRIGLDRPELVGFDVLAAFGTVLTFVDGRLNGRITRQEIGRLLETRAALGARWADGFAAKEATDEERAAASDDASLLRAAVRLEEPSSTMVAAYVTRGAFRVAVEGAASDLPSFAEELAATIDALIAAREASFVARRWLARQAGSPTARMALTFAFVPRQRAAAASSAEVHAETRDVRLGALAPVAAEARLILSAHEVELRVYPEAAGAVCRVELGDVVATNPTDGDWIVRAPMSNSLRVRVLGKGGREFDETISLIEEPVVE